MVFLRIVGGFWGVMENVDGFLSLILRRRFWDFEGDIVLGLWCFGF